MPGRHDDDSADPFEGRLGAALRQTGGAFDTDGAALVTAGRARGRRLRLRRRAAVLGGAASLALVGAGGALVLPGGEGEASPAAGQRKVTTASATPAPTPVTADEMVAILKSLLPAGETRQEHGGGGETGSAFASVVFDDGQGGGAVGVGLGRIEPGSTSAREMTTCPDKNFVPYDACDSSRLPDGSLLLLMKGYEYPDRRVDTKLWQAQLITPEGQHVSVTEWNAEAEKDAPVTRPEPPLSLEQLKAVASADEWRGAVDSLPENPKGAPAPGGTEDDAESAVPRARVLLGQLLPKGLEVVSSGGTGSEYGYVVADDGEGRTLVQVNNQRNMSDVAGELFDDGDTTLEDGTRVAWHQGPGEKGGEGVVMWTVDTLRPDGRRVVVSAFNSGAQHTAATRPEPALTMDQLQEIALDPRWLALG
ncbi:hypothetical protein [Streptomyces broussonetiae]|uniref:LigA protein n=1 Tax=Streptomyces broussonetiae TaxID=2686304 RepID=A0ABV5E6R6_9ACTN